MINDTPLTREEIQDEIRHHSQEALALYKLAQAAEKQGDANKTAQLIEAATYHRQEKNRYVAMLEASK